MLYGWNPDSDEEQIPAHADFPAFVATVCYGNIYFAI